MYIQELGHQKGKNARNRLLGHINAFFLNLFWVVVDEFDNEKRNQLMRANLMVN